MDQSLCCRIYKVIMANAEREIHIHYSLKLLHPGTQTTVFLMEYKNGMMQLPHY